MTFLVDTNVLSEATRPKPDRQVVDWLSDHESQLHVSTLTLGELRYGIERLGHGKKRDRLQAWR